jgi:hypothetical protein
LCFSFLPKKFPKNAPWPVVLFVRIEPASFHEILEGFGAQHDVHVLPFPNGIALANIKPLPLPLGLCFLITISFLKHLDLKSFHPEFMLCSSVLPKTIPKQFHDCFFRAGIATSKCLWAFVKFQFVQNNSVTFDEFERTGHHEFFEISMADVFFSDMNPDISPRPRGIKV